MSDYFLNLIHNLIAVLYLRDLTLIAILFSSVVAAAVFMERLWNLRSSQNSLRRFFAQVKDLLFKGKRSEVQNLCQQNDSPLARVLLVTLSIKPKTDLEYLQLKERIDEAGRQEALEFEGASETLSTISSVATLLGLFGTVVGMVEIFDVIAVEGAGKGSLLTRGIATALVNTIFGLAVAIPSLVAYKYCMHKVRMLVAELERYTFAVLEMFDS